MSNLFTVGHVAQLNEIQNALLRDGNRGIGPEVDEFIRKLNDHGVVYLDGNLKAARKAQAKRYWDSGIAAEIGYKDHKQYLRDVPEAPRLPLTNATLLHPKLLLIEPRIGFEKLCEFAKVDCRSTWVSKRNKGDAPEGQTPFWIAFDDGRRHRGLTIDRAKEVGGNFNDRFFTAFIGVCAVLQSRGIVAAGEDPYYMHLIGTFDAEGEGGHANLQMTTDLVQIWDGYKGPESCAAYGTPSYVRY